LKANAEERTPAIASTDPTPEQILRLNVDTSRAFIGTTTKQNRYLASNTLPNAVKAVFSMQNMSAC